MAEVSKKAFSQGWKVMREAQRQEAEKDVLRLQNALFGAKKRLLLIEDDIKEFDRLEEESEKSGDSPA